MLKIFSEGSLRGSKYWCSPFLGLIVLLSGCSSGETEYLAGDVNGINHTSNGINFFSVDGYGGSNVSPHGYGGSVCCVALPRVWRPGLSAHVEWQIDPNPRTILPRSGGEAYMAAIAQHKSAYESYSEDVPIPEYGSGDLCSLKIHFLPCHKLEATTSCFLHGSPHYPIKEPRVIKDESSCKN